MKFNWTNASCGDEFKDSTICGLGMFPVAPGSNTDDFGGYRRELVRSRVVHQGAVAFIDILESNPNTAHESLR